MTFMQYLRTNNIRPYSSEFASVLGISKQHLGDIAKGRRRPSLVLALKIEELTKGAVLAKDFTIESTKGTQSVPDG